VLAVFANVRNWSVAAVQTQRRYRGSDAPWISTFEAPYEQSRTPPSVRGDGWIGAFPKQIGIV
jgi:hypothetical protein